MPYIISKEAIADLDDLWLYIAEDDPIAADGVIDYLNTQFQKLSHSPNIGRIREDLWAEAYCHNTGKGTWRSHFLIFYRIGKNGIEIARIIEGHRNITPDMFE